MKLKTGKQAGIAIALELMDRDLSVLLLESGTEKLDPRVQALYEGEVVDLSKAGDVRIKESLNPQGEGAKYLPLIGCPPPAPVPGAAEGE